MEFIYLFGGLLAGVLIFWFIVRNKLAKEEGVPLSEVENNYVQKSIYEKLFEDNKNNIEEIVVLNSKSAKYEEHIRGLEERLSEHKKEIEELQKKMHIEFQNLSNKIFEEKSTKFLELNEKRVNDILNPLKEKINQFEKKVDDTYKEETRERISLKKELEHIVKLNQQVSEDTIKLTKALKGDKKLQGDWGEVQLEMILAKTGLEKDIHYRKQESLLNEAGKIMRPDYIINLPEGKNLIIDSKVSLIAYEQYFNEENESLKPELIKRHVKNIAKHISDLSSKNYNQLYEINSPDYVLLFVPIEPALYVALKEDTTLFEKALDKNIVLVSTSTLLATLRTISFIWKQDNQKKNVFEIAKESGALYDKFVGFIEDLTNLGKKIDGVKSDYSAAINKLYESKQKGSTIIGRIERIKKLGASTSKSLPKNILDRIED